MEPSQDVGVPPDEPVWGAYTTVWIFTALPFTAFASSNPGERLDVARIVAAMIVIGAFATGMLYILQRRRSRQAARRTAVVLAVALFAFFNFHLIASALASSSVLNQQLVWLFASTAAVVVAAVVGRSRTVQSYVLVVGSILVLVNTGYVVLSAAAAPDEATTSPSTSSVHPTSRPARTPDIYYFVTDAYGSAEVLLEEVGLDISGFEEALERRGFRTSQGARANYPLTFLSVASALEMEYVVEAGSPWSERRPFYEMMGGSNRTVETLKELGYRYVHVPAGVWTGSDCTRMADVCLEPNRLFSETEWAFLGRTPIGGLIAQHLGGRVADQYADPTDVALHVRRMSTASPLFVVAHIMSPHPPYRRTADCGVSAKVVQDLRGWDEEGRQGYADAVTCLNDQLLATIDTLLQRDRDAIVVIQGDHGPAFRTQLNAPPERWSDDQIRERFSVFSSIRLPSGCDGVTDDLALVNTFRIVLSCVLGEPIPLLPSRLLIATYDPDLPVRDVTAAATAPD